LFDDDDDDAVTTMTLKSLLAVKFMLVCVKFVHLIYASVITIISPTFALISFLLV